MSFSLVIDADIARSSGTTEHPVSSGSRRLLESVASGGHKIVMCPTLRGEWKEHRSRFSAQWMASMIARRKVMFVSPPPDIADHIVHNVDESKTKAVALKDAHLLDAALVSDKVIASNDDRARAAFCLIARGRRDICSIIWLNAVTEGEVFQDKLLAGRHIGDEYYLNPVPD